MVFRFVSLKKEEVLLSLPPLDGSVVLHINVQARQSTRQSSVKDWEGDWGGWDKYS